MLCVGFVLAMLAIGFVCVDVAAEEIDLFEKFPVSQGHPQTTINNYVVLSVWKYLRDDANVVPPRHVVSVVCNCLKW